MNGMDFLRFCLLILTLALVLAYHNAMHAATCDNDAACTCVGCWSYGTFPNAHPDFPTLSYGNKMVFTLANLDNDVYQVTLSIQNPVSTTIHIRNITVTANDQPFLTDFNIFAQPPGLIQRSMMVPVTDGKLVISVAGSLGRVAVISGISLSRAVFQ